MNTKKIVLLIVLFVSMIVNIDSAHSEKTYSGIYNNKQIIPTSLANYCQCNAEDMVKNINKLYECIDRMLIEIKSSDSNMATEAREQWGVIRYELMGSLQADAIAKGAQVPNKLDDYTAVDNAASKPTTEHEIQTSGKSSVLELAENVEDLVGLYGYKHENLSIASIENIENNLDEVVETDDDKNYSGAFKNRQIIPHALANYCQLNIQDAMEGPDKTADSSESDVKFYNCVNALVSDMNSTDASKAKYAKMIWNLIYFEELKIIAGNALLKRAAIADAEDTKKDISKKSGLSNTESDDLSSNQSAIIYLLQQVGDFCDEIALEAQMSALEGIKTINGGVIEAVSQE